MALKHERMRVSAARAREIRETDHNALMKRSDAGVQRGEDKGKRGPAVPKKAKDAIAVLIEQPKPDHAAVAQAVGLATKTLKYYLGLPHVRRYHQEQKKLFTEAVSLGNPAALKDVRDNSGNAVARVNAVRALELMQQEQDETARHRSGQSMPGFVIMIGGQTQTIGPMPPVIDATDDAVDDAEFAHQDDR